MPHCFVCSTKTIACPRRSEHLQSRPATPTTTTTTSTLHPIASKNRARGSHPRSSPPTDPLPREAPTQQFSALSRRMGPQAARVSSVTVTKARAPCSCHHQTWAAAGSAITWAPARPRRCHPPCRPACESLAARRRPRSSTPTSSTTASRNLTSRAWPESARPGRPRRRQPPLWRAPPRPPKRSLPQPPLTWKRTASPLWLPSCRLSPPFPLLRRSLRRWWWVDWMPVSGCFVRRGQRGRATARARRSASWRRRWTGSGTGWRWWAVWWQPTWCWRPARWRCLTDWGWPPCRERKVSVRAVPLSAKPCQPPRLKLPSLSCVVHSRWSWRNFVSKLGWSCAGQGFLPLGMAAVVGRLWIMSLVFLWLSYLLHDVQSQISVTADINNFERYECVWETERVCNSVACVCVCDSVSCVWTWKCVICVYVWQCVFVCVYMCVCVCLKICVCMQVSESDSFLCKLCDTDREAIQHYFFQNRFVGCAVISVHGVL